MLAHGTIDKFIRGSEPQYATRQLLRKLYSEEYLNDLPTDPDPEVTALFLIHLLNRIPDEHRRATYDYWVRSFADGHVRAGADIPPWVIRLAELYEEDAAAHPPAPRTPKPGPTEYPRKRNGKKS